MNHPILVAALAEDRRCQCSCGAVTQEPKRHVPQVPGGCSLATRDRAVERPHRFTLDNCRDRERSALRVGGVAASDHR
jgi:hypothetical protein